MDKEKGFVVKFSDGYITTEMGWTCHKFMTQDINKAKIFYNKDYFIENFPNAVLIEVEDKND